MGIANTSGAMGNVLRLQGLKNVSGRRVMPGQPMEEEESDYDIDVEGTAPRIPNFSNFMPPEERNLPQPEMGGELNSQSYDVRSNSIVDPQRDEEPSMLRKFGESLANLISPNSTYSINEDTVRDAQNKVASRPSSAGLLSAENWTPTYPGKPEAPAQPPQVPSVESQGTSLRSPPPEPSEGILGAISDYLNPTKRSQMGEYNKDVVQDAQLMTQGKDPNEARSMADEQQTISHDQKRALEEPFQHSAYGSAQQVANNPALSAQFKQITGIDYETQIAEQVTQHEEAMKGIEDSLNGINTQLSDQAEGIKQRILNNQSTDFDKYYIGMALLMPLIIGGMFGKEAGIGALGGAAQGFSNVLSDRQNSIRTDEGTLLDLSKQQASNQEKLANIGMEKAKFAPSLRKNLPEDTNAHLIGMREVVWKDPNTGEEVRGREVKPGLIARPEFVATKEGKADMLKAANELSEVKSYVDEVNDLTEDIINIVTQLEDPSFAWKGLTSILSGKSPTILSKMTQDVMVDGRKVNSGIALEEKLGFLANAYGMAKEIGQLDRAAQVHIKKIIENPTGTFLTPQDSLNQILEVRKLSQNGLMRQAANKGFYPDFVMQDSQQANSPLFNRLNQSEDEKYNEQLKRKAFQGEVNYAQ